MGACSTACSGFFQIPRIGVGGKDNVASLICDTVVGLGHRIVKKPVQGGRCVFSGSGLLCTNGIESDE